MIVFRVVKHLFTGEEIIEIISKCGTVEILKGAIYPTPQEGIKIISKFFPENLEKFVEYDSFSQEVKIIF